MHYKTSLFSFPTRDKYVSTMIFFCSSPPLITIPSAYYNSRKTANQTAIRFEVAEAQEGAAKAEEEVWRQPRQQR